MTPNDATITASPKVAGAVVTYASATGVAAWFDLIHGALAIVSMVVGIAATVFVIRSTIQRHRMDAEEHRKKMSHLDAEIRVLKAEEKARKGQG